MITFTQLGKLGRLGNSMFQIAATAGHARMMGVTWCVPDWTYRDYFHNKIPHCNLHGMPKYTERAFHYSPIPKKGHLDLFGYFQSKEYFAHCEPYIKELFTPTDEVLKKVNSIQLPENSVSIHVRRTDYLALKDYHYNLTMAYYEKAMSELKGNYVIFSDDIEWCKNHFSGTFIHEDEITDLFLMAKCERHIIANSSFSWWAAYLGGGDAVAPKDWFGRLYRGKNTKDLYLKEWKTL